MSTENNRAIITRLYKEVFQEWNTSILDNMVTADFQDHLMNGPGNDGVRGPKVLRQLYAFLRSAFPDLRFDVHDVLAENDRVMVRWSFSGTHKGDLAGVPPTGRAITVEGIAIYRLQNDRIVERWVSTNLDQLIQRLGQQK